MKAALGVFLLLAAALAQSLTPPAAWLGLSKPPCLLAVAVYYALVYPRGVAVTVAIAAGVMQDSASLMPLGYSAFWFSGFGLLLHAIREVLFRDSLLTMAAIGAAAGGLTVPALYAMLALGTDTAAVPFGWLALKTMGNALFGLAVMPLVWLGAGALERQMGILHPEIR